MGAFESQLVKQDVQGIRLLANSQEIVNINQFQVENERKLSINFIVS